MASAGRPQAGRTAVRLFRWCVPKKSLCSLPKVKAFPREQWFQSRWFLTNFGARRFPKGNEGKRVSSGYNRRRRLATGRSGKQQAERTAVRTAPIVCPEESPLLAATIDNFAGKNSPWAGIDAPTPAREQGLQLYGALYCFEWRSEGDWGRAESPQCARRRIPLPCPRWGLTRRLRRELGLAVPRGAHTFLSVAKEKCAKESQRHGDSGKKPFIAHFDGGARNVARNGAG